MFEKGYETKKIKTKQPLYLPKLAKTGDPPVKGKLITKHIGRKYREENIFKGKEIERHFELHVDETKLKSKEYEKIESDMLHYKEKHQE